ncbi:hypothetical protein VIGAN_05233300, partial [Vigna angularis var. angularis]
VLLSFCCTSSHRVSLFCCNCPTDIVAKLFSFSQQRPSALCSLTRTGTVSSITLRQPGSTSISVSYEARLL